MPTNHSSSSDSSADSTSSDESYGAKDKVQVKKPSFSKVSSPRPPRIMNFVLGLATVKNWAAIGKKTVGKRKPKDDLEDCKLGKKCVKYF